MHKSEKTSIVTIFSCYLWSTIEYISQTFFLIEKEKQFLLYRSITCLVDNVNTDLVSRFEQKLMWKKETFGALSRLRQ